MPVAGEGDLPPVGRRHRVGLQRAGAGEAPLALAVGADHREVRLPPALAPARPWARDLEDEPLAVGGPARVERVALARDARERADPCPVRTTDLERDVEDALPVLDRPPLRKDQMLAIRRVEGVGLYLPVLRRRCRRLPFALIEYSSPGGRPSKSSKSLTVKNASRPPSGVHVGVLENEPKRVRVRAAPPKGLVVTIAPANSSAGPLRNARRLPSGDQAGSSSIVGGVRRTTRSPLRPRSS